MAIRNRRGAVKDLVESKLLPGEFAICTDGSIVICYAAGKTAKLSSVDDIAKLRAEQTSYKETIDRVISDFKEYMSETRNEAVNARQAAEDAARKLAEKLSDGSLKGETGPPGPPGIQGPQGVQGPEGQRGGAGLATSLGPGIFEVSVNDLGHLIVRHNDNDPVPPLSIVNGRLKYTIS